MLSTSVNQSLVSSFVIVLGSAKERGFAVVPAATADAGTEDVISVTG